MKKTICIILAALLCGCGAKGSGSEEVSAEPVDSLPEDREAAAEEITKGDYDNFTFAEGFSVEYAAEAAVCTAKPAEGMESGAEGLFSYYLGEYDSGAVVSDGGTVHAETAERFALITDSGSICLSEKSVLNRVLYGTNTEYLSTYVFGSDDSTEELKYNGTAVTAEELKKAAEAMIAEVAEASGFSNELRPFGASVQVLEDGTAAATVHSRTVIEGLPIFDTMSAKNEYSFEICDLPPACCIFTEGSAVQEYTVGQELVITDRQPCDIIAPDAAMDLASEKLSAYQSLEVQREELVLMPKYPDSSRTSLSLEPYWVIWFCTDWWHECFAAVDARSGEVEFVKNSY
ncbi:MAG: hypothetical protein IJ746_03270 [Ruminococcus sp.]|nr:hypothetical protein [Ruminococcus sp.]